MGMFVALTALCALAGQAAAQSCYSMDGSLLDTRYQPCFPQAESSACCMLNGTQGENQQNDLCMDSGLCQSTSGWYAGFLYMNGCTDETGKADGCPKLCSFMGNQYSWNVLQCEPGKFCCRAASDTENCCNNNASMISTSHIGNLLLPGSTAAINTTFNFTVEAPAVANSSESSNATCSDSISNSNNTSICPANNSAAVGGAVGGVLGAALIGALIALAFALRSRKHCKSDLTSTKAVLTSTEQEAATYKANAEKQLEYHRQHTQSMPPHYPHMNGGYVMPLTRGYTSNSGSYTPSFQTPSPPVMEMDTNNGMSELGGGCNDSRVELTSESARRSS